MINLELAFRLDADIVGLVLAQRRELHVWLRLVPYRGNSTGSGGPETIARVRLADPATYFRVVASILPKDVLVNVQQQTPGNLEPDEWRVLDLVRLIRASAPEGANALPSDIAPALEETVRAHFARPIEQ